jgi:type 2 lantibiotic biosynthesis protein LanM
LLGRWESLLRLKSGDSATFELRLQRLGLKREAALERLLPRPLPDTGEVPGWGQLLGEVLNPDQDFQPAVSPERPLDVPEFPDLLSPFVSVFLHRLDGEDCAKLLSTAAREQVARSLLSKLSAIAARTVAHEVKRRSRSGELCGDTAEARYQFFAGKILGANAGRTELFSRYPVLARLLATCTLQMLDATIELVQRLDRDWDAIAELVGCVGELGPVSAALDGLSDRHRGGRSVWLLEFAGGVGVVYKPRSVEIDVAYGQFVAQLNLRAKTLSQRCAKVISRAGYGWCEVVRAEECRTRQEVARFFRRQGMHVAVFYFLCGIDFHEGNFIAAGEWPVPVDLEGILTPTGYMTRSPEKQVPVYLWSLEASVVMTSMLPKWKAGTDDRIAVPSSAIHGGCDRKWPVRQPLWRDLGTDRVHLVFEHTDGGSDNTHLPHVDGQPIPANDYLDEVLQGFREAYRAILRAREQLLEENSPLDHFRSASSRVLIRDTQEYASLLYWATAPDQLTSGAAYDVALEALCAAVTTAPNDDHWLRLSGPALLDEEKRALWQRDIPLFLGSPTDRFIQSGDGSYGPVAERTSHDQMQERFRCASEEDLAWQVEIIRATSRMALQPGPTHPVRASGASFTGPKAGPGPSAIGLSPTERERLLAHAVAIGDALDRLAVHHPYGSSWLSLCRLAPTSLVLQAIHPSPWTTMGAASTAVFLANLAAQTGDRRYENLARAAVGYTSAMYERCAKLEAGQSLLTAGLNGSGLLIYARVVCASQFGDEELSSVALEQVLSVSADAWARVDNPDVLTGAAGVLLALLTLYRFRPDDGVLERAIALAEGILQHQQSGKGPHGWRVPGFERPLLGMAHGAAGISSALHRLFQVNPDPRWAEAAQAGLDYERSFFCQAGRDWPNLQQPLDEPHFMTGWCAGAPGIGLARLAMADFPDPRIHPEIDDAISATRRHLGAGLQNLCCGEAGRIVFLNTAAQRLGRTDLQRDAVETAMNMLDRYEESGFWRLQNLCERNIIPGLLDGISGIGLAFLNLTAPGSTSNFLLVD